MAFLTQVAALGVLGVLAFTFGKSIATNVGILALAALLGLVNALSINFYYRALKTGPMSIVSPICGSYAIVAVPLAAVFLHDVLLPMQYIGVALVVAGVFLVEPLLSLAL